MTEVFFEPQAEKRVIGVKDTRRNPVTSTTKETFFAYHDKRGFFCCLTRLTVVYSSRQTVFY